MVRTYGWNGLDLGRHCTSWMARTKDTVSLLKEKELGSSVNFASSLAPALGLLCSETSSSSFCNHANWHIGMYEHLACYDHWWRKQGVALLYTAMETANESRRKKACHRSLFHPASHLPRTTCTQIREAKLAAPPPKETHSQQRSLPTPASKNPTLYVLSS